MKKAAKRILADSEIPEDEIDRVAEVIASYDRMFMRKGIRFIFLPIPDKENIYYDHLPFNDLRKPEFLSKLTLRLQKRGIEVVDTQKAFDEAFRKNNISLYHTDDTHWNKDGVRITADLVEKLLKGSPSKGAPMKKLTLGVARPRT